MVHSTPFSGSKSRSPSSGTDLSNDVLHSRPGRCPRAQAGALQHTCRLTPPSLCGKPRLWMHSLDRGLVGSGLLCRGREVTETQHQATYVGALLQGVCCDSGLLGTLPNSLTSWGWSRAQMAPTTEPDVGVSGRGAQERQPKPEERLAGNNNKQVSLVPKTDKCCTFFFLILILT